VDVAATILLGAIVMGDIVAGLFFLRYWRRTGDRFFLFFAASFILGAVSRLVIDEHVPPADTEAMGYSLRLVQYVMIIVAIVDKNRVAWRRTVGLPVTSEH
jgi:Family of unknown function (DUF5985)